MTEELAVCVFCSSTFPLLKQDFSKNLHRFLTILERRSGKKVKRLQKIFSIFHASLPGTEHLDHSALIASCPVCSHIMESCCDYYHEIKCLELKLLWRLQTFSKLMKSGGRVQSRVTVMKNACDELDAESQTVECSAFRAVCDFKKQLIRKCSHVGTFPKVSLALLKTPSEEGTRMSAQESEKKQIHYSAAPSEQHDSCFSSNRLTLTGEQSNMLSFMAVILLYCSLEGLSSATEVSSITEVHQENENHPSGLPSPSSNENSDSKSAGRAEDVEEESNCAENVETLEEIEEDETDFKCEIFSHSRSPSTSHVSARSEPMECEVATLDQLQLSAWQTSDNTSTAPEKQEPEESNETVNETAELYSHASLTTSEILDDQRLECVVCEKVQANQASHMNERTDDNQSAIETFPFLHEGAVPQTSSLPEESQNILSEENNTTDDSQMQEPGRTRLLRTIHRCDICRKTFSTAAKLDSHRKSHEDDPPPPQQKSQQDLLDSDSSESAEDLNSDPGEGSDDEYCEDVKLDFKEESNDSAESASESEAEIDRSTSESEDDVSGFEKPKYRKGASRIYASKAETKALQVPKDLSKLQEHEIVRNSLNLQVLEDEDAPTLENFLTNPVEEIFKYHCEEESCSNIQFLTTTQLTLHKNLHGTFKCNFCEVTESYAPYIAIHERNCESSGGSGKEVSSDREKLEQVCPRCVVWHPQSTSICSFVTHFLESHLNLKMPVGVSCPLCRKRFQHVDAVDSTKCQLMKHMIQQHDTTGLKPSQIYTCRDCPTPANFRTSRQLNHHNREIHPETRQSYACGEPECSGLTFPSLRNHVTKYHESKYSKLFPLQCDKRGCLRRFRSRRGLNYHRRRVHPTQMPFPCKKCGKGFLHRCTLEVHKFRHSKDFTPTTTFSFMCPRGCKKGALSYTELKYHFRDYHKLPLDDSNFDPSCIVKTQYEAFEHTSEKFKCGVDSCSELFGNQVELENHRQHHGNFECHFCSKTIRNALELAFHELEHSGYDGKATPGKSFYCPRCTESFESRALRKCLRHFLNEHLNLPWATVFCSICQMGTVRTSKAFADKYKLSHFNWYHNVSKMDQADIRKCDNCPAYFRRDQQLENHMRDIHDKLDKVTCPQTCTECGKKLLHNQEDCKKSQLHELFRNSLHLTVLSGEGAPTLENLVRKSTKEIFKYQCEADGCSNRFLTVTELAKHSRLHGKFECSFCHVTESFAPNIALHERKCKSKLSAKAEDNKCKQEVAEEKLLEDRRSCPKCMWVCRSSPSQSYVADKTYIAHYIEKHLNLEVPLTMACPLCHMKFFGFFFQRIGMAVMIQHIRSQHDVSGMKQSQIRTCKKCPTPVNFRDRHFLRVHNKEVHLRVQTKYTCDEPECAGMTFPSLRSHMSQQHKARPKEKQSTLECTEQACPRDRLTTENHVHDSTGQLEIATFGCETCGDGFEHKYKLEVHKLKHAKDYDTRSTFSFLCPYKCSSFGSKPTYTSLQMHLKESHDFILDDSNFEPSMIVQIRPEQFEHTSSQFTCDIDTCQEKFGNATELENHKRHHGTFECHVCSQVLQDAVKLALHEKGHFLQKQTKTTKQSIECSRCEEKFWHVREHQKYLRHFLEVHLSLPGANVVCSVCQMGHIRKNMCHGNRLKTEHFKTYHDVSNLDPANIRKCGECPAYFKDFRQLQHHKEEVHDVPSATTCSDCGKKYCSRITLRKHLEKVHKLDSSQLPVACRDPQCSGRFPTEECMEMHAVRVHSVKQKIYKCPKCQKLFLMGVIKRHTQQCGMDKKLKKPVNRSFVCETCGKAFVSQENLRLHNLSHVGPEGWEFCCEICSKKCLTKQKLEEHRRTHSKEKPFQCDHCGEKYAHRHNLRNHVNNKHGDIAEDVARSFNKANLSSRKGIPRESRGAGRKRKPPSSTWKKKKRRRKTVTSSSSDFEQD